MCTIDFWLQNSDYRKYCSWISDFKIKPEKFNIVEKENKVALTCPVWGSLPMTVVHQRTVSIGSLTGRVLTATHFLIRRQIPVSCLIEKISHKTYNTSICLSHWSVNIRYTCLSIANIANNRQWTNFDQRAQMSLWLRWVKNNMCLWN